MFIETNCCIEHNGVKFCSGGAVVTETHIVGYIGKLIGDGMGCDRYGSTSRRYLTDWHGNNIGTCAFSSTWRINSYMSNVMHQVYAVVNGVTYTGRSMGEGMLFRGKRTAKQ